VPYVHPFDPADITAFRRAVGSALSITESTMPASDAFISRLKRALCDDRKRAELKRCYRILASDHNRVSLREGLQKVG
jgi:hypothetical protein